MEKFLKDSKLSNKAKNAILCFITDVRTQTFQVDYSQVLKAEEQEIKILFNYLIDMRYVSSKLNTVRNCGFKTRNEILIFLGRKPIVSNKVLISKSGIKVLIEGLEKIYASNLGDEKLIASQVLKEYKNFLN
jgi:hypothetical protein